MIAQFMSRAIASNLFSPRAPRFLRNRRRKSSARQNERENGRPRFKARDGVRGAEAARGFSEIAMRFGAARAASTVQRHMIASAFCLQA